MGFVGKDQTSSSSQTSQIVPLISGWQDAETRMVQRADNLTTPDMSAGQKAAQNYYNAALAANPAGTSAGYYGQGAGAIGQGLAALGNSGSYINAAAATPAQMAQTWSAAGSPVSATDIANYTNPFQQQVVNATLANIDYQNRAQQAGLTGQAIQAGASPFGGDRAAIAQAELAHAQNLSRDATIAGLNSQGFNTALSAAQADKGRLLQQASGQGSQDIQAGLGAAGANTALGQGIGGLGSQYGQFGYQSGILGLQGANALANTGYQQQVLPLQVLQTQQGVLGNIGAVSNGTSGTSQTTSPGPSPFGQLIGLGTLGLGAYNAGIFRHGGAVPQALASGGISGLIPESQYDAAPGSVNAVGIAPLIDAIGGSSSGLNSAQLLARQMQQSSMAQQQAGLNGGGGFSIGDMLGILNLGKGGIGSAHPSAGLGPEQQKVFEAPKAHGGGVRALADGGSAYDSGLPMPGDGGSVGQRIIDGLLHAMGQETSSIRRDDTGMPLLPSEIPLVPAEKPVPPASAVPAIAETPSAPGAPRPSPKPPVPADMGPTSGPSAPTAAPSFSSLIHGVADGSPDAIQALHSIATGLPPAPPIPQPKPPVPSLGAPDQVPVPQVKPPVPPVPVAAQPPLAGPPVVSPPPVQPPLPAAAAPAAGGLPAILRLGSAPMPQDDLIRYAPSIGSNAPPPEHQIANVLAQSMPAPKAAGLAALVGPDSRAPDGSPAYSPQRVNAGIALMAAGLGMMASRSKFPGVAIGEGGLAGLQVWQHQQQQDIANRRADIESARQAALSQHYLRNDVSNDALRQATGQARLQQSGAAQTRAEALADQLSRKGMATIEGGDGHLYSVDPSTGERVDLGEGRLATKVTGGITAGQQQASIDRAMKQAAVTAQNDFDPAHRGWSLQQKQDFWFDYYKRQQGATAAPPSGQPLPPAAAPVPAQTAPSAAAPPSARASLAPEMRAKVDDINARMRSGVITRDQALSELGALGFPRRGQ